MSRELETLRWQFALAWRLADEHCLAHLSDEACLWEPAPGSWTVHRSQDGAWRPDWREVEPDPPPATTIGWLSWHLIWWWSSLLAVLAGASAPRREEVTWPGDADATRARLDELAAAWRAELDALAEDDLERPLAYPWAEPRPLRLALAWANLELMKNAAEIGAVLRAYRASRDAGQAILRPD